MQNYPVTGESDEADWLNPLLSVSEDLQIKGVLEAFVSDSGDTNIDNDTHLDYINETNNTKTDHVPNNIWVDNLEQKERKHTQKSIL